MDAMKANFRPEFLNRVDEVRVHISYTSVWLVCIGEPRGRGEVKGKGRFGCVLCFVFMYLCIYERVVGVCIH